MIIGNPITLGTSEAPIAPSPVPEKDVNFIDYDGTVLYSYTAEEFAQLSVLPEPPVHDGLAAQGWNWSLSGAKNYVEDCGKLTIGQLYTTDDGRTRIHISLTEERTSPYLGIAVNGTVEIDWGDGSAAETVSGTKITGSDLADIISTQHNYAQAGAYIISIRTVSGQFSIRGALVSGSNYFTTLLWKTESSTSGLNACYRDAVKEVHIGDGCVIGNYAFCGMRSLSAVTVPNGVTLQGVVFPFYYCYALQSIVLPNGVSLAEKCFFGCYSLLRVSLPETGVSVDVEAFSECRSLTRIHLPANLTSLARRVFYLCTSLVSVTYPSTMTSLGFGAFSSCRIREIKMPVGLTTITGELFLRCESLTEITIPENVTTIESTSFDYCTGLKRIVFQASQPPAVTSSGGWLSLPSDCVIVVPAGSLSAYTSAANYPDSSVYTYVEEN